MPVGFESPFPPPVEAKLTLTKVVVLAVRSRKKTLRCGATSTGKALPLLLITRLLAVLENSTKRPFGLRTGPHESPLPPTGGGWEESRTETSCKGAADIEPVLTSSAHKARCHADKRLAFINACRINRGLVGNRRPKSEYRQETCWCEQVLSVIERGHTCFGIHVRSEERRVGKEC